MKKVIYVDGHSEKCPICGSRVVFMSCTCRCVKCGNEFIVSNYDAVNDKYKVKDCSSGKKLDKRSRV